MKISIRVRPKISKKCLLLLMGSLCVLANSCVKKPLRDQSKQSSNTDTVGELGLFSTAFAQNKESPFWKINNHMPRWKTNNGAELYLSIPETQVLQISPGCFFVNFGMIFNKPVKGNVATPASEYQSSFSASRFVGCGLPVASFSHDDLTIEVGPVVAMKDEEGSGFQVPVKVFQTNRPDINAYGDFTGPILNFVPQSYK